MKLNEGDNIDIAGGLPMQAGVYWVAYVSYCHGNPYYSLRKFYSRGIDGQFFTNAVDSMVGDQIQRVA